MTSPYERQALQKGIAAAKAGRKQEAHTFLLKAVEQNPDNESIWLWLAVVCSSLDERAAYLRQALAINPNNARTRNALAKLEPHLKPAVPSWRCPLCQSEAPSPVDRCPACRALLVLTDIEELLDNQHVNREQMQRAITHYERASNGNGVDNKHYFLGLAYLNLGQIDEGLNHLRATLRLRPEDKGLQAQIGRLLQHKAQLEAQAEAQKPSEGAVLIVDDSPTVCKLVSMTLERHGYTAILAADGLEALARLNEQIPDLILLDITMPRMDGYQLCKIVKGNEETKDVPVVMLSGKDGFFDKVRGRMAGSTDYITKPFDPQTLLQVVRRHAGHRVGS